jgi:hypothetical protein
MLTEGADNQDRLIIAAAFALNIGHPGTVFKSSGILHPDGPNIKRESVSH